MTDPERVRQYVERQKAYLPSYTSHWDLVHPTPLHEVGFGFDTPVLRPRVPHKKDRSRKEAVDTDSERAARLADRRERKRKKRAIVNPPQKNDDDDDDDKETLPTTAPRKGRAKKPAALALLYGFSATNVTKDRLTLKPAPSLGVFSKGRASAKKKIAAARKASSRNELFSESAFLNKPSERVDDPSKIDDDSSDSLAFNNSIPGTNGIRKDRDKCTTIAAPKPSTRTTADSGIWDIELESKLPSSARDVSIEPQAKGSASIVLNLQRARWAASIDVAEQREESQEKTQTPRLSVTRNRSSGRLLRGSQPAGSDLGDQLQIRHTDVADVSSLHPSHSASQIGRCAAADTQASSLYLGTSKYFSQPKPVPVVANPPQSNDGIDVLDSAALRLTTSATFAEPKPVFEHESAEDVPKALRSNAGDQVQDTMDTALNVQTVHRVASPIDSFLSAPLPMIQFQTRYDKVPAVEVSSDSGVHDNNWAGVDVPWEHDRGYFGTSAIASQDDQFMRYDDAWDLYPLATDDAEFEENYDALMLEHECDHEDLTDDGSVCDGQDDVTGFLEGRALLLGVPGHHVEVSGLVQAEMDVARRLRDHWRPQRL